jgi:hypothetical protein
MLHPKCSGKPLGGFKEGRGCAIFSFSKTHLCSCVENGLEGDERGNAGPIRRLLGLLCRGTLISCNISFKG